MFHWTHGRVSFHRLPGIGYKWMFCKQIVATQKKSMCHVCVYIYINITLLWLQDAKLSIQNGMQIHFLGGSHVVRKKPRISDMESPGNLKLYSWTSFGRFIALRISG